VTDNDRSEAGATSEVRTHSWTIVLTESQEWGSGRAGVGQAVSPTCRAFTFHTGQMKWHLYDYRCMLLCGIPRGSFQETAPRKTAENTAKHCGVSVGSLVASHRGGGESAMVVTTLIVISLYHVMHTSA